jgi:hypothetical protein
MGAGSIGELRVPSRMGRKTEMGHDVFISYASRDKPTADAACAFLEARGIRCWMAPRDILSSMDWSESIVEAIENCYVFVLVFSSRANESPQIKREVERAVNKSRLIVPFRIEDVMPTKSLEYFISTPHWLDAMSPPVESHLGALADTIRLLLERRVLAEKTQPLRPPAYVGAPPSEAPGGLAPAATTIAAGTDIFAALSGVGSAVRRTVLKRAPGLVAALPGYEERYLRAFGSLFGGGRLDEPPPAALPRFSILTGYGVGAVGVLWNLWFLFETFFPRRGSEAAYFFSLFPITRALNFGAQAFGLLACLALVAGAHRADSRRPGGLVVLRRTARHTILVVAAWIALTMGTLLLSSNWRRHLAASNRWDLTLAVVRAAALPALSLGAVAWLSKRAE